MIRALLAALAVAAAVIVLAASSHAVGFYTALPPGLALATAVHVQSATAHGHVTVVVRAGSAVRGVRAVVQLDLVCAGGR